MSQPPFANPYLRAMGITQWLRREPREAVVVPSPRNDAATQAHRADLHDPRKAAHQLLTNLFDDKPAAGRPPTTVVADTAVPSDVRKVPRAPSIQPSQASEPVASTMAKPAVVMEQPLSRVHTLDWGALASQVADCRQCGLAQSRTQTVFGVGNQQADWLIIGEAPGQQEDQQGEPFVGRAGLLLNNMLMSLGLKRAQVYIANVIKCRPPENRDPEPAEVDACAAYLARQIELIRPKIILVVGRIAAQSLLATDAPVGRLRGQVHFSERTPVLANIPIVVTYHPAYLLRRPAEKAKGWLDLKLALAAASAR